VRHRQLVGRGAWSGSRGIGSCIRGFLELIRGLADGGLSAGSRCGSLLNGVRELMGKQVEAVWRRRIVLTVAEEYVPVRRESVSADCPSQSVSLLVGVYAHLCEAVTEARLEIVSGLEVERLAVVLLKGLLSGRSFNES
jgi:hypothetical protein